MTSKLFILLKSPHEFNGIDMIKEIAGKDKSAVLLFEDATYYSVDKGHGKKLLEAANNVYVMSDDIAARGFDGRTMAGYEMIDYGKAVDLIMEQYDQTITL